MESFLNLLWVAIAVGAFCFWRTRWLYERRDRGREPLREWTAFACVLVLLFFAVSLTDDLHSESVIFDECSAGRRHSLAMARSHDVQQQRVPEMSSLIAVQPYSGLLVPLKFVDRLTPEKELVFFSVDSWAPFGRAPPLASS
ncbi:MAG TPA: hypothetical protein VN884_11365 [Candidatus Sulfotelmatobacter sp.]|jgi:hypothetical protein|nr:hypothetical protein [Candidatus Sulfotelmatobacter sp.]